jgi:hypothetical protein
VRIGPYIFKMRLSGLALYTAARFPRRVLRANAMAASSSRPAHGIDSLSMQAYGGEPPYPSAASLRSRRAVSLARKMTEGSSASFGTCSTKCPHRALRLGRFLKGTTPTIGGLRTYCSFFPVVVRPWLLVWTWK